MPLDTNGWEEKIKEQPNFEIKKTMAKPPICFIMNEQKKNCEKRTYENAVYPMQV